MLQSLFIQNYALIEQLSIDWETGFSVITGETGAGKSIILGAIGLLLGQRADVKSIRKGTNKCVIEAHFNIAAYDMQSFFVTNELEYDDECILRRELSLTGKSRAFINDIPVSLVLMKELGEQLIDIHSQHQNLLLNKEDFQINILDILGKNKDALIQYQSLFQEWKQAEKALAELIHRSEQAKVDEEYIRFQLEQLENASLQIGEQEDLEQEQSLLAHAEEIKANLYRSEQLMDNEEGGVLYALRNCCGIMQSLQVISPFAEDLAERLESCYIELKDITQEIEAKEEEIEYNPSRLAEVNERLNLLYALQQKHRVNSIEALLALQEEFSTKLSIITSSDNEIISLRVRCKDLYNKVCEQAKLLTHSRLEAAEIVKRQMMTSLIPLGMPNVCFEVKLSERNEPGLLGMDTVNFLFSANKNGVLQNISSVASGGEIARVMLSLKALIAGVVKLPTIIFDEIDTGVSGEIADRMADIMEKMSDNGRQVISITHLPQIASRGGIHYKVYKEDNELETNSYIRRLLDKERVEEVAQMLSGATLTEAALQNAYTLLYAHREGN